MVAGAAPRRCLNSPTGISCFFLSLQSGNQLTTPQMSGNLQGFNIQSHYQWRKPLVLHLLVTLLLINQQKHFIPPLHPTPPPTPASPRNTIGNGYSVLLIDIKKRSKFGNLELENYLSHEMSSVVISSHGWRFQLLNQNPDHVDEDHYVDLWKQSNWRFSFMKYMFKIS